MVTDAPRSYSIAQRIVHWLSVLLILFNLVFSEAMEHWNERLGEGWVPTADDIASANIHAYVGLSILALLVIRLVLRRIQGAPLPPQSEPPIFQLAAKLGHGAIYLLLVAMPLSGLAAYYGEVALAGLLHGGPMKVLLWLLLVVHIGAALVHKFVWKTDVMDRMTKGV